MNECKISVDLFLNKEIKKWTGLPNTCSEQNIRLNYLSNGAEGTIYAGEAKVKYNFGVKQHSGFPSGVNFFFSNEMLEIITAEYWSMDTSECREICYALGEPDTKVKFYWRDVVKEKSEWVYHSKGITLDIVPETGVLARVIVYPPCSFESYKQKYYFTDLAREF